MAALAHFPRRADQRGLFERTWPRRPQRHRQQWRQHDATTTARDSAVKFAECMRDNGVPDFPDPNASGEFVFGVNVPPEV